MIRALSYSVGGDWDGSINIDHIVRMSKGPLGKTTYIPLSNGEVIESIDSIRTLEARINYDGREEEGEG